MTARPCTGMARTATTGSARPILIPEELDGKSVWIRVSSQIDEWDDGRNPQFIVFVNGEVYQGIDMNHRECLITRSGKAGETLTIDLQAYTGIMHEEFALRTQIEEIDAEIEKLYYDLWVPLAAFSRMEADDKNRKDIEYVLNETINLLDLRTPYSKTFTGVCGKHLLISRKHCMKIWQGMRM